MLYRTVLGRHNIKILNLQDTALAILWATFCALHFILFKLPNLNSLRTLNDEKLDYQFFSLYIVLLKHSFTRYYKINITPLWFYFFVIGDIKPSINITRDIIWHLSNSVIRNLIGNSNEFQIKFTVTHN